MLFGGYQLVERAKPTFGIVHLIEGVGLGRFGLEPPQNAVEGVSLHRQAAGVAQNPA